MHEEDGQADVEQDDHADHDGVWALRKQRYKVSVCSVSNKLLLCFTHCDCPELNFNFSQEIACLLSIA